ncbi:TPA: hypothetical protein RQP16_003614 [Klebsiella michiganensis]|uniref:hypothetical protein n=1 Tax=Klebsiella michiganensis TaxID=1134687 RepID=UPI00101F4954|nr:hypothetical protein [Klebsiella michiganensis]MCW9598295.1 hypothetical protein [Klebsiella michiganensis]HDX9240085.1 hypothetical protein [Klebsiella michiganensis]
MAIRRGPRPDTKFYTLDKSISEDPRLSWGARGLLIYLLGKPDNWEVSVADLINQTQDSRKPSGRDAVRSMLNELKQTGYLHTDTMRGENGVFDGVSYVVSETPVLVPETDYPATDSPLAANPPLISNEYKQILNNNKNTLVPSDDDTPAKPEKNYPQEFEKIWAMYPRREGSNPKNKAFQAWNARKREGVDQASIQSGLQRYIAYCQKKGQVGTSYVMQAARFFGPSREFENDWSVSSFANPVNGKVNTDSTQFFSEQVYRSSKPVNQNTEAKK